MISAFTVSATPVCPTSSSHGAEASSFTCEQDSWLFFAHQGVPARHFWSTCQVLGIKESRPAAPAIAARVCRRGNVSACGSCTHKSLRHGKTESKRGKIQLSYQPSAIFWSSSQTAQRHRTRTFAITQLYWGGSQVVEGDMSPRTDTRLTLQVVRAGVHPCGKI